MTTPHVPGDPPPTPHIQERTTLGKRVLAAASAGVLAAAVAFVAGSSTAYASPSISQATSAASTLLWTNWMKDWSGLRYRYAYDSGRTFVESIVDPGRPGKPYLEPTGAPGDGIPMYPLPKYPGVPQTYGGSLPGIYNSLTFDINLSTALGLESSKAELAPRNVTVVAAPDSSAPTYLSTAAASRLDTGAAL